MNVRGTYENQFCLNQKMQHTDYEIMSQWLSTKEVLEFYGDMNAPFTLQQVIDNTNESRWRDICRSLHCRVR